MNNLKNLSNYDLLKRFENACFRVTNYPSNKTISQEFARTQREIANRLNLTDDEITRLENEEQ